MHVVPSEGAAFDVAAGASFSYDYSINGPFSATVNNTVTGDVTLAGKYGCPTPTPSRQRLVHRGRQSQGCQDRERAAARGGTDVYVRAPPGCLDCLRRHYPRDKDNGRQRNISFATSLVPGQTYQLCEWVFPGWNTNLAAMDRCSYPTASFHEPAEPNVNNLTVCVNFSVTSGQTRTFSVDNTPPPGGRALTIGFWKNWASCSASNGKAAADP